MGMEHSLSRQILEAAFFVGTYKYILQTQAHRGDDPDPSQGAHHRRGTVRRACAQPQVSGT